MGKEKVKRINIVDARNVSVQVEATAEDTLADLLAALDRPEEARLTFGGMDLSNKATLRSACIEDEATLRLIGADTPAGSGVWESKHHPTRVLSDARANVPKQDEFNTVLQHFRLLTCGPRRQEMVSEVSIQCV